MTKPPNFDFSTQLIDISFLQDIGRLFVTCFTKILELVVYDMLQRKYNGQRFQYRLDGNKCMDGKWDNLFWQLPSSDNSTQLEVNTTKNLFKTLQDSNRETSLALFDFLCEKLSIEKSHSVKSINYSREYSGTPNGLVEEIFLIGISQNARTFKPEELVSTDKSGGQADGSIVVQTEESYIQFIIEVKTGKDNLSKTQLGKYCNKFSIPPENVTTIQWREIGELFESLEPESELTRYLMNEFIDYLRHQKLDRNIALFEHYGYEKSMILYTEDDSPIVAFRARQEGKSDKKKLTREMYVDLFTEFFDGLGLTREDRRRIFMDGDTNRFTEAVEPMVGNEIASTDIGFSDKARYRIELDSHSNDGALLKFQKMREDGTFGEFPNTYHVNLTEQELINVVQPESGPGFSDKVREALFVDIEPEDCF